MLKIYNMPLFKINVHVGYCTLSISELGKMNFKGGSNGASRYVQGSNISFYCRDNGNESPYIVATCMKNGSWSPDPHTYYICQSNDTAEVEGKSNNLNGHVDSSHSIILFTLMAWYSRILH